MSAATKTPAELATEFCESIGHELRRLKGESAGLEAIIKAAVCVLNNHAERLPGGSPEWSELMDARNALSDSLHLVEGIVYVGQTVDNDADYLREQVAKSHGKAPS